MVGFVQAPAMGWSEWFWSAAANALGGVLAVTALGVLVELAIWAAPHLRRFAALPLRLRVVLAVVLVVTVARPPILWPRVVYAAAVVGVLVVNVRLVYRLLRRFDPEWKADSR